ncbi:MAG TPA: SDR family oxidoreductase [Pyrinomonadaceae bacterium]|jgi:short-subunit dehydrogenase|nr:SDR family oxidoreductase [Pyrinomonadaceae bacterium]
MNVKLKKLSEQVMVITGASSGIGLVTARMAAKRGTRLILNARNEDALRRVCGEIRQAGGEAYHVAGDVGRLDDVQNIADEAFRRFGGFDTWVNNAGVSIYGPVLDQSLEDQRRLFETNYWGVVHGSRVACAHLRTRGGALINLGSVLSDIAIPIQGTYCATKHAVKGYTDALRLELEAEGAPIAVTLIKPSAIDTPYVQHAKNLLPSEPQNPAPVYAPDTVAEAILHCAEHPERDVYVGGAGKMLAEAGHHMPRLMDKVMEQMMIGQQQSGTPKPANRPDSLHAPSADGEERGRYSGHVSESSVYTKASVHPLITGSVIAGLGIAAFAAWRSFSDNKGEGRSSNYA